MDFVGGLLRKRKGHYYMLVVFDRFNKMCILMPCKKTIKGQDPTNMLFEKVWVHFGIPKYHHLRYIYYNDQCLLDYTLGENRHNVDEIYKLPSTNGWTNRNGEHDICSALEGLKPKASKKLGQEFDLYLAL